MTNNTLGTQKEVVIVCVGDGKCASSPCFVYLTVNLKRKQIKLYGTQKIRKKKKNNFQKSCYHGKYIRSS